MSTVWKRNVSWAPSSQTCEIRRELTIGTLLLGWLRRVLPLQQQTKVDLKHVLPPQTY